MYIRLADKHLDQRDFHEVYRITYLAIGLGIYLVKEDNWWFAPPAPTLRDKKRKEEYAMVCYQRAIACEGLEQINKDFLALCTALDNWPANMDMKVARDRVTQRLLSGSRIYGKKNTIFHRVNVLRFNGSLYLLVSRSHCMV